MHRPARSPLAIRHALLWARAFAWLAGPGRAWGDRRELHDELAALYTELADAWTRRGAAEPARRARARASQHVLLAGPPDHPPAAAGALPHPPPLTRTDARGRVAPPRLRR